MNTVTISLPNGDVRKSDTLEGVIAVVAELVGAEKAGRAVLLDRRLALGAALLQVEKQVSHGQLGMIYARCGVHRKTAAWCKKKAAAFADEHGVLDPDRLRAVQAVVAATHTPAPGSRLERLTRLEPSELTDRALDELVGNRPLPPASPFVRPAWAEPGSASRATGEPNDGRNVLHGEHFGEGVGEANGRRNVLGREHFGEGLGSTPCLEDSDKAWHPDRSIDHGDWRRPRVVGEAGVVGSGGRQMSLAEAVAAAADEVIARVEQLRRHADEATLAMLEQVLGELGQGVGA